MYYTYNGIKKLIKDLINCSNENKKINNLINQIEPINYFDAPIQFRLMNIAINHDIQDWQNGINKDCSELIKRLIRRWTYHWIEKGKKGDEITQIVKKAFNYNYVWLTK